MSTETLRHELLLAAEQAASTLDAVARALAALATVQDDPVLSEYACAIAEDANNASAAAWWAARGMTMASLERDLMRRLTAE